MFIDYLPIKIHVIMKNTYTTSLFCFIYQSLDANFSGCNAPQQSTKVFFVRSHLGNNMRKLNTLKRTSNHYIIT